jgi:hypothetical protein
METINSESLSTAGSKEDYRLSQAKLMRAKADHLAMQQEHLRAQIRLLDARRSKVAAELKERFGLDLDGEASPASGERDVPAQEVVKKKLRLKLRRIKA